MALAKQLELSPEEADTITNLDGNRYEVGKDSWLVCTDSEADNEAKESVISLLDDVGIGAFNVNLSDIVNEDWFAEALQESYQSYAYEIKDETDHTYGNRLVQEMYDKGILSDEDFKEDEEGNIDYSEPKIDIEDKIEEFVDGMVKDAGDPVYWYKDNFGEEAFNRAVKEMGLVNENKLAQEVIDIDGRGHILNRYDGNEYEVEVNGVTYYLYED